MIWSLPPQKAAQRTEQHRISQQRLDLILTSLWCQKPSKISREAHRVLCFGDIVKKPLLHLKLITIKHYVSCNPPKKVRERERKKKQRIGLY